MDRHFVLLRHGESADKQPGQRDFDRVLTAAGHNSICQLGLVLASEKIFPDLILSSTAKRAVQTVESLLATFTDKVPVIQYQQALYDGASEVYLELISNLDESVSTCLIVGHNPSISSLIGMLTGQHAVALHPGQAAWIESGIPASNKYCSLLKLIGPFL